MQIHLKEIRFFEQEFQRISGTGDLKSALANLVQLAMEGAKSNSGSFYIADSDQRVLRPLITCGLPASYIDACGPVRIGDQCCGRAVEHRMPWIVSDMLTAPAFRISSEVRPRSLPSALLSQSRQLRKMESVSAR